LGNPAARTETTGGARLDLALHQATTDFLLSSLFLLPTILFAVSRMHSLNAAAGGLSMALARVVIPTGLSWVATSIGKILNSPDFISCSSAWSDKIVTTFGNVKRSDL
jgi:hypothetical protein